MMQNVPAPIKGPGEPVIRPVWLRVAIFLVVFLGAQAAGATIPFSLLAMWDPGFLENQEIGTIVSRHLFLITILATIPGIVITLFFWRRVDRRGSTPLAGFTNDGMWRLIARGSIAAVWLMTLASMPALFINRDQIRFLPAGPLVFLVNLPGYIVAFALVAMNEEMSFRGYVLKNLMEKVNRWVAVGISSVLFASLHLLNPNLTAIGYLNLHLAGALLALSVLKWGSLWYAIAFHFAWNTFQAVVLALPVSGVRVMGLIDVPTSGPAWLSGGEFGPEGSAVTTLLLVIACVRMARGARPQPDSVHAG